MGRRQTCFVKNNVPYTSVQLMNHFVSSMLAVERERDIPNEPPVNLPDAPDKYQLGTMSELLDFGAESSALTTVGQLKEEALQEHSRRLELTLMGKNRAISCEILMIVSLAIMYTITLSILMMMVMELILVGVMEL